MSIQSERDWRGLRRVAGRIISAGSDRAVEGPEGWTLRTSDGSLSAHHEHTAVITRGRPILLTAA